MPWSSLRSSARCATTTWLDVATGNDAVGATILSAEGRRALLARATARLADLGTLQSLAVAAIADVDLLEACHWFNEVETQTMGCSMGQTASPTRKFEVSVSMSSTPHRGRSWTACANSEPKHGVDTAGGRCPS